MTSDSEINRSNMRIVPSSHVEYLCIVQTVVIIEKCLLGFLALRVLGGMEVLKSVANPEWCTIFGHVLHLLPNVVSPC